MTQTENLSQYSIANRVSLAREVGQELSKIKGDAQAHSLALSRAEALVTDWCQQVREVLAFELRHCKKLPKLIACKIACDVDEIAGPFLRVTPALSDSWMAELVPLLSDNAHLALAVRADIGPTAACSIACHGNENSALALLGNPSVALTKPFTSALIDNHDSHINVMNALSKRPDLPLSVATEIIGKISEHFRDILQERFGIEAPHAQELTSTSAHTVIWRQIRHANPAQVHAQVIDLRVNKKLTHELTVEMAERGNISFMESALALETGRTLMEVREILHLATPARFVELMRTAGVPDDLAPRFLKLAKKHYSAKVAKRSVGIPSMWQKPTHVAMEPAAAEQPQAI